MENNNEWIPVMERLPREDEQYANCWLTILDTQHPDVKPKVINGYYCGKTKGGWRNFGTRIIEVSGIRVIAWKRCYMPEPYILKEEKS